MRYNIINNNTGYLYLGKLGRRVLWYARAHNHITLVIGPR